MKLSLTIDPLLRICERSAIIGRLARGLNTTREAANLRLDRAIRGDTTSISRSLLAELFLIADDLGVDRRTLLVLETRTVFDLLPAESTLTYVGGYGMVAADEASYGETITTSVWDYRAAGRFGRRISPDFGRLRFAPSTEADPRRIAESIREELAHATRDKLSLVSLGSSKSSALSEWLLAAAVDLTPFSEPGPAQNEPPFRFFFVVGRNQLEGRAWPRERATGVFLPEGPLRHSYLVWEGERYNYQPPAAANTTGVAEPFTAADNGSGSCGRDYAVVLVQGHSAVQGTVVVAGLTGVGTFGATALLCSEPALFELPEEGTVFVRAFLVEVEAELRRRMREPVTARIVAHWTKGSRVFAAPVDSTAHVLLTN